MQGQIGVGLKHAKVPDGLPGSVIALKAELTTAGAGQERWLACDDQLCAGVAYQDIPDCGVGEIQSAGYNVDRLLSAPLVTAGNRLLA